MEELRVPNGGDPCYAVPTKRGAEIFKQKQQDLIDDLPEAEFVFNAIRLTNYYTNLLSNPETNELIDLKISGSSWRNKQLAYQIPHQDIKLLASSASKEPTANQELIVTKEDSNQSSESHHQRSRSAASIKSQSEDEIDFIRSQRKLASQFKASLFYLNPVRQSTGAVNQSWSAKKANKRGLDQQQQQQQQQSTKLDKVHQCFKCKLPIEYNTSCVRVDNLRVNFGDTLKRPVDHQHDGDGKNEAEEKCQSSQDGENNNAIAAAAKKTKEKLTTTAIGEKSEDKSQPSSSCDEGMGTGSSANSSGQSSTAGSHCDDRETPPHVGIDDSSTCNHGRAEKGADATIMMGSVDDGAIVGRPKSSCDIIGNYKLSLDSLYNMNESNKALKNRRRTRSSVLVGDEQLALEVDSASNTSNNNKSKRNRALTWTASLGSSIGASFKQLSGGSKSAKSLAKVDPEAKAKLVGDEESEASKTILFHKECFCCSTCNELLVDLRALIYMNESIGQQQQPPPMQESDIEYVNLPTTTTTPEEKTTTDDCSGKDEANQKRTTQEAVDSRREKNISLYCHRHFVELFKPRCQQCDCLILDEECTEAEGKVWHIKHFCCTECKVPLGGQQYIIVDQSQKQQQANKLAEHTDSSKDNSSSNNNKDGQQRTSNAPYCLRCFDQVFGETCEACGKLITCNLGAINHEQRCWHASPGCFKCRQCQRSLLGKPFLPSADGHIYCSLQCSDSKFILTNPGQQQKLSLAQYCDPRAPSQQQQHQQQQHSEAGLIRHKPLIDYLLANAASDETSHQLLRYLYSQFNAVLLQQQQLKNPPHSAGQEKLVAQIGATLKRLEEQQQKHEQVGGGNTESSAITARRNKLNPFLIDSFGAQEAKLQQQQQHERESNFSSQHENNNNSNSNAMTIVMDGLEQKLAAAASSSSYGGGGETERMLFANYINLDCCQPTAANQVSPGVSSPKTKRDSVDNATHLVNSSRQHSSMMALRLAGGKHLATGVGINSNGNNIKASQCSPAASLVSNEGTISDHSSATSSGISSTAPTMAGGSQSGGSLKSHSPLSSTSSHSSISSSNLLPAASVTATVTTAAAAASMARSKTAGQQMQMINSIAASVERRRRVQPITELSVADLLSVADDKMLQQQQQQSDVAFDQLVSHFETNNSGIGKRGNLQLQQQRPICGQTKQQQLVAGQPNKQQESFFQELAQRLPNSRSKPAVTGQVQVPADTALVLPSIMRQLDTNGLPTVEQPVQRQESSSSVSRIVTDHYSTVNKAHKLQQQQAKQMANDEATAAKMRESFFAITSPLLDCEAGRGRSIGSGGSPACGSLRPTSSLSVLTPDNTLAAANQQQFTQQQQHLQASFSSSSLLLQPTGSSCFGMPAAINQQQQQQPARQQPKAAKSVTFDPAVKDPPSSSSSTMTLGRASALRSALKQSSGAGQTWMNNNMASQYSSQFLATTGSSATLPSSLASQIKANAAYTAFYDSEGRRIKLSSVMNQCEIPLEEAPSQSTGGSSILSKLGLLQSSSSRGGRREERKLRQKQQQQQQPEVVQAQPMSLQQQQQLFVQPLDEIPQQAFMGQMIPLQQQQQQVLLEPKPTSSSSAPNRHRYRSSHQPARRYSSSSRRSSRRNGGSSSKRRRSSDRRSTSSRRSAKYCTDTDCYDEDADDSDSSSVVSRCSTCSSGSYASDDSISESELSADDYSDDDNSSASESYTSCSSYSGSDYTTSASESENDDYSSSSASSSRSSSPCSSTRSAGPATSSSAVPLDNHRKSSRPTSRRHHHESRNSNTRQSSSSRHSDRSRRRRHRRRSESSNSSRARSSSRTKRSSSSSRDQRRRRQRNGRDRSHERGSSSRGRYNRSHGSNKSTTSSNNSRSASSRNGSRSNRSSSSHRHDHGNNNNNNGQQTGHSGQHRSSSSHHHSRHQHATNNPTAAIAPDSIQPQQQQLVHLAPSTTSGSMRSKSPSTMSTDSKSVGNNNNNSNSAENCRLI